MIYEHATFVVSLGVAVNLRKLAQMLDRAETDGMFQTALSATGNLPATHFISSGQVPSVFVRTMESPALLHTRAQAAYAREGAAFSFTLLQVTNALSNCTVSNGTRSVVIDGLPTVVAEDPHALILRLGLKIIQDAT